MIPHQASASTIYCSERDRLFSLFFQVQVKPRYLFFQRDIYRDRRNESCNFEDNFISNRPPINERTFTSEAVEDLIVFIKNQELL